MKIPKNVNVDNDSYRILSERAIMLRTRLKSSVTMLNGAIMIATPLP